MKLSKEHLTDYLSEDFYASPRTMTFYKNNNKTLRIRDVSHLLPLENNLYLFGVGDNGITGKYIIPKDMFDFCIWEYGFDKNYQSCKNLLRDFKKGRTGTALSKRIDFIYKTYQIDFLPRDWKVWLPFILRHYNYNNYYLTETLNLDKESKNYLRIEFKLRERKTEK